MTRASRIRLLHLKRTLVLASGLLISMGGAAHDLVGEPIPSETGGRAGISMALSWIKADTDLPLAKLPGVLSTGGREEDRNGFSLEHGVIDVGVRFNDYLGTTLALGWHGSDSAHVEAAWVQAGQPGINLGLGRNRVPLGPVLTRAGHMDRFALMPLAKQAAFEGDWIDDGINMHWRHDGTREIEVNAGVWRAKAFPGVKGSDPSPALHMGGHLGNLRIDGFIARLQPEARGTEISMSSDGHSHGTPSCARSLTGLVCFDGDSDLAGASLRWHVPDWPLELSAAGIVRREKGNLYSSLGDTRYRGETRAGWLEATWMFRPHWDASLRTERLVSEHDLAGVGASLVARDAGFLPESGATSRQAFALAWQPRRGMTVSAEIGAERVEGVTNGYFGLRLLWSDEWRHSL